VTQDEVLSRFVDHPDFAASTTRASIWDSWSIAQALLRSAVRVPVAWLSGGFVSSKVDPEDVDATFFVSLESYNMAGVAERKVIESFTHRVAGPTPGKTVSAHGIAQVDSFAILWAPFQVARPGSPALDGQYVAMRGYWDDWWSRRRSGAKTDPFVRADALPRRGYLEVVLDGFI
jgi:hypothetical protein